MRLGVLKESLQAFEKLHSLIPASPEVLYQIANLHDMMGNYRAATKWFNILVTRVPTDPDVLSRLGQIYNKDDNETQAFHYHMDSYRYYPVNLDVISWLGVWYVKSEFYERAIEFFERAAEIQPGEVKWKLMVTSCYRRMGNYQKALELYEDIYREYPENLECLRYLVAICKDLGMKYDHFQRALGALERRNAQQRIMSHEGGGGPRSGQMSYATAPQGGGHNGMGIDTSNSNGDESPLRQPRGGVSPDAITGGRRGRGGMGMLTGQHRVEITSPSTSPVGAAARRMYSVPDNSDAPAGGGGPSLAASKASTTTAGAPGGAEESMDW